MLLLVKCERLILDRIMKSSKFILGLCLIALIFCGAVSFAFLTTKAQTSDFPEVVSSVAPNIPTVAVAVRAFGKVTVDLSLDSKGKVESAKAVQGHPLLRKATEDAVLQWKFASAKETTRTLQMVFDYSFSSYDEYAYVTVSPYQIELKAKLPERPKPPETVSYIPKDWQPETDRCEVHGELFKKDKVEIIYGDTVFRNGFLEAQEKLFPHANTEEYGGCIIENDAVTGLQISPKYAEVLYCSKCRKAQKKWSRENRDKPFN